jgi:hypothetical protein
MLTWTAKSDGWYSNGFRIIKEAPGRWVLLPTKHEGNITEDGTQRSLATGPSLPAVKREAEQLHVREARLARRKRVLLHLVGATAVIVMLEGAPFLGFVVGLLVASLVIELVWLWAGPKVGGAREVTQ